MRVQIDRITEEVRLGLEDGPPMSVDRCEALADAYASLRESRAAMMALGLCAVILVARAVRAVARGSQLERGPEGDAAIYSVEGRDMSDAEKKAIAFTLGEIGDAVRRRSHSWTISGALELIGNGLDDDRNHELLGLRVVGLLGERASCQLGAWKRPLKAL